MGYRKKKAQHLEWKKRLQEKRELLISCGVPIEIYEDESRWWYLLEHGYDYETKWDPEGLSEGEIIGLLNLLRDNYPNDEAWCLIKDLEKELDKIG